MLVAIYIRVSSRQQIKGISLEDQERQCREHATRQGWAVIEVYADRGKSGRYDDRPELQRLKSDAARRRFQIVLFYKVNRLGRNLADSYAIAAEVERFGVQIASATETFDRTTASGKLTFGMLALVAQFESDQLAEKMRDTRLAEARQGRHVGPIPVGFRRERGMLIPDEYAPAVCWAFQLYATRQYSFETVCEALADAGYTMPSGGLFTKFQVAEMLRNPVYIGRVVCGEQVFGGQHVSLIDQATWESVQEEIVRRAAISNKGGRGGAQPALLSGLAHCSNCGALMWRSGAGSRYYACSARLTRANQCNLRGVHADVAEAHVLASLAALILDDAQMVVAMEEVARLQSQEAAPRTIPDPARIEAQIKRLARLYELGLKGDEDFEHELGVLRAQQTAPALPVISVDPQRVAARLRNIPTLLAAANRDERRAVLLEVFEVVYLAPHQATALKPRAAYAEWLKLGAERLVEWAGWASSSTTRIILPSLPVAPPDSLRPARLVA